MRASGCIGKVTTEISQRSIFESLRTPGLRVGAALDRAKADGKARRARRRASAPALRGRARSHGRMRPRTNRPARVLAQFEPDADRLRRIVLEQELDAFCASLREAFAKSPRQHQVAAEIDDAEATGVARERARRPRPISGRRRRIWFRVLKSFPNHLGVFRARRALGWRGRSRRLGRFLRRLRRAIVQPLQGLDEFAEDLGALSRNEIAAAQAAPPRQVRGCVGS